MIEITQEEADAAVREILKEENFQELIYEVVVDIVKDDIRRQVSDLIIGQLHRAIRNILAERGS